MIKGNSGVLKEVIQQNGFPVTFSLLCLGLWTYLAWQEPKNETELGLWLVTSAICVILSMALRRMRLSIRAEWLWVITGSVGLFLVNIFNPNSEELFIKLIYLGVGSVVLIFLSPAIRTRFRDERLTLWEGWYFLKCFLRSVAQISVAIAGISIAGVSINTLFQFPVPAEFYSTALAISIFPTLVLLLQRSEALKSNFYEADPFVFISSLFRYVVIPVVILYFIILYLFVAKILYFGEWPVGTVNPLVILLSLLVVLVHINQRTSMRSAPMNIFMKFIYLALIPLVIVQLVAIHKRVQEFGFTQSLAVGATFAIWILVLCGYYYRSDRGSIHFIPLSLLAFLGITFSGPFSPNSVALHSQTLIFESIVLSQDSAKKNKPYLFGVQPPGSEAQKAVNALRYICLIGGQSGLTQATGVVFPPDYREEHSVTKSNRCRPPYYRSEIKPDSRAPLTFVLQAINLKVTDSGNSFSWFRGTKFNGVDFEDLTFCSTTLGREKRVACGSNYKLTLDIQDEKILVESAELKRIVELDLGPSLAELKSNWSKGEPVNSITSLPSLSAEDAGISVRVTLQSVHFFRKPEDPLLGYLEAYVFIAKD